MSEAITIPQQLIRSDARFVKVRSKSKAAFEPAWEQHTYTHDNPDLTNWLMSNGNYGVVSHNGIGTFDIDDLDKFKSLGLVIPDTFTDCREGSRFHSFFKCDDIPDEYKEKKITTPWGDIRFPGHNSYVVGTGCIAPNKSNELKTYEIHNDAPIRTLQWTVIEGILKASVKETISNPEIQTVDIKEPYTMKDGVKKNHYTVISYVGKEMATNVPIVAIHAALQSMNDNNYFDRKRTPEELVKEVDSAIEYTVRKNGQKILDKELPTRNDGKDTPKYDLQPRGWFERAGVLYLEVIDTSSEITEYSYASCIDGKVYFIDDITVREPTEDKGKVIRSGLKYVPRDLPINKDGQPIYMVGITDKNALKLITQTDAHNIKQRIYTLVNKYCDMPVNDVDLCVYYIFMTWFYPKLSTLPYLRFRADTGKGKSRILKVISDLSFMPVKAGGASTAAGTIRIQEYWHGTLVIDEADIKGDAENEGYQNDMIKFLNLGFERGQYFVKSDKVDPKRQEIFDPFSPKIIAMRGIFQDPATEGRCLSISPSETERKDIPAILPAEYNIEVGGIRALMTHYVLTHWDCITDDDPYPSFNDVECEPRLKQLGSPMARVLSKVFPDGLAEFKHYIERRQVEVKIDRAGSFVGGVVNAAYDRAIDPENKYEVVTIREVGDTVGTTSNKVSRVLKDAGMNVEARKVKITIQKPDGDSFQKSITQKIVVVNDARAWREVCRRYITARSEQQSKIGTAQDLVDCPAALKSQEFVSN